jgi:hypothetical protein
LPTSKESIGRTAYPTGSSRTRSVKSGALEFSHPQSTGTCQRQCITELGSHGGEFTPRRTRRLRRVAVERHRSPCAQCSFRRFVVLVRDERSFSPAPTMDEPLAICLAPMAYRQPPCSDVDVGAIHTSVVCWIVRRRIASLRASIAPWTLGVRNGLRSRAYISVLNRHSFDKVTHV